jgi:hypothetical protein
MIDILIAAGYERTSATGRVSTAHPLFQHLGPNRYRVVSDIDPETSVRLGITGFHH